MKRTHRNFPDSLLQQYNFGTSTTDAPAAVNDDTTDIDEPEEEAAIEPQAEADTDADDQSTNLKKRVSSLQLIVSKQMRRKNLRKNPRSPQLGPLPSLGKSISYDQRKMNLQRSLSFLSSRKRASISYEQRKINLHRSLSFPNMPFLPSRLSRAN